LRDPVPNRIIAAELSTARFGEDHVAGTTRLASGAAAVGA
jgi:hypothetical protein